MTSTGRLPEPWKSTAATLFNPYLNLNQIPNPPSRQQSVRTRILTPNRHSRAPPESIIETGSYKLNTSELLSRSKSKKIPNSSAAEEVSIYIQQMIHNQFCGRSGTPSDMRYDDQKLRQPTYTPPQSRLTIRKTVPSSRQQSRVSESALDDFFNTADQQMSRMASMMPGRESSFSENHSIYGGESTKHRSNHGERLTLADVCHIASNVGDKMSQSKEKIGQEAIRGYRLPSARLAYEPYEHHPMEPPLVLGHHSINDRIRLSDVLTDDNFSSEPMIEIIGSDFIDDGSSRASRTRLKSTTPITPKLTEFKDWRGKISQPNLPDVRSRAKRQQSATIISPQRPCTAASNFSKSRPDSSGVLVNDSQKLEELENPLTSSGNISTVPVNSALKNPSSRKQRQRSHPLNVRIDETINKEDTDQVKTSNEPPTLSIPSEITDEQLKTTEIMPGPTPDPTNSKSTTAFTTFDQESSEKISTKKPYKLIRSSSQQIYRTISQIPEPNKSNQINEQFTQLTLSQLELLENYDPTVSTRIGIPFIPVQMLARPRDAHQSAQRSIEQIQKNYPKKNGQPIFEARTNRPTNNLVDITQTLQLTKSKRIHVERQTTFEKPVNEAIIEEAIQIKSLENPKRLAISFYPSSEQVSLVKHTNSTRTSTKVYPSQLDNISTSTRTIDQQTNLSDRTKEEDRLEYNLSVLNLRTQQVVDQMRRREKPNPKRPVFPTSIVTNANLNSPRRRNVKQHSRPISSVFITQDPDELRYSASVYRQAKNDVDIKRAFKGFVVQNLQRKLSADERKKREEEQKAAIKIQRAYREHLQRRFEIENRRPSTSQRREQERDHRRLRSAKRAQFVEQQLIEQTRIRDENKEYQKMLNDIGPSLQIYASFNQMGPPFSKATLHRAATCIQRWWRGFIVRHRWDFLKREVAASDRTWFEFSARYRGVVQRIQKMRQSEYRQFIFNLNETRDFLIIEKKLTTIYNALSFNNKLDQSELENFFECCDLSVTPYEIQEALQTVLQHYPQQKNDSLSKEMVFDIVYYIYPPVATGLETSRKSTWVRPIIDGEDETAIQGTPFLEPIDLNVVYKFLGKQ